MLRAMIWGQSMPWRRAARSASVGSALGAGAGAFRRSFSVARSTGFSGEAQAISAAARSSSLMRPAATRARMSSRGRIGDRPATRVSRAAAWGRSSSVWPRNGLTATVAARGKAGGIAAAAAVAAPSRPAA